MGTAATGADGVAGRVVAARGTICACGDRRTVGRAHHGARRQRVARMLRPELPNQPSSLLQWAGGGLHAPPPATLMDSAGRSPKNFFPFRAAGGSIPPAARVVRFPWAGAVRREIALSSRRERDATSPTPRTASAASGAFPLREKQTRPVPPPLPINTAAGGHKGPLPPIEAPSWLDSPISRPALLLFRPLASAQLPSATRCAMSTTCCTGR